jgi:hypothetical protein
MADDIDIDDLIEQGYDQDDITEAMLDAGYDVEDMAEAWADADYDWHDALHDTLAEQLISEEEFRLDAAYYADLLDISESEAYDLYFGYGDDAG